MKQNWKTNIKKSKDRLLAPIGDWFVRNKVRANYLSAISVSFGALGAALTISRFSWLYASAALMLHVIFDILDGTVARRQGPTPKGYLIDFLVDRVVIVALLGILVYLAPILVILLALYVATSLVYFAITYVQRGTTRLVFLDGLILLLFIVRFPVPIAIFGIIILGVLVNVILYFVRLGSSRRQLRAKP